MALASEIMAGSYPGFVIHGSALKRCLSLLSSAVVFGVFLAACNNPAHSPAAAPLSDPMAAPATPTSAAPPAGGLGSWVMPNLVGSNLQDAQNAIQRLTENAIFVTTSHDATGAGRQQVLDRNWKVCIQNVPPGHRIQADTTIDFGAVKTDERCP